MFFFRWFSVHFTFQSNLHLKLPQCVSVFVSLFILCKFSPSSSFFPSPLVSLVLARLLLLHIVARVWIPVVTISHVRHIPRPTCHIFTNISVAVEGGLASTRSPPLPGPGLNSWYICENIGLLSRPRSYNNVSVYMV